MTTTPSPAALPFSRNQKVVVGMLAYLQFAVILDFMLISPLGAVIMPRLAINPRQFGLVVSAYAFSAALAGLLTAGFADRLDRKKILLFFYGGFVLGTLWCGLADSFEALLAARIVTGVFGGVISSVMLAIATDLFPVQARGRVMGIIQTAFSASQVMGVPVGMYLSNHWGWHAPFLAMTAVGVVGGLFIAWRMQPVTGHLEIRQEHSPWLHLLHTVAEPCYLLAFATTALMATGGFMLMPFSSAFMVHNLGISFGSLPTIYLLTGLCTIFVGPLVGKASDALGRIPVLIAGSALTISMVLVYTHLEAASVPGLLPVYILLFVGIFARMIPFQALMSSIPEPTRRGSFNSINTSAQQLSGGMASLLAGHIVMRGPDGRLENLEVIGYVVVATSLAALGMIWHLQKRSSAGRHLTA